MRIEETKAYEMKNNSRSDAKGFYVLLYSLALRTLSLSPLLVRI